MSDLDVGRRSLILAGGGMKVAFQAGVLQVWLDEAGIEFDHADGASGGVFNLAMWCQGMSGAQIADNWRDYRPLDAIQVNPWALFTLPPPGPLFKLDRFPRVVLPQWGIDWDRIRSTERDATFNLFNFSRQRHVVLPAAQMDEARLISAVSLPMWFPPVEIGGDIYIDAVFVTDANLEAAIDRGADELWIIWTVSTRGEWHRGFVAHYFQMIEAMANSQLAAVMDRIRRSNDALARSEPGEFGRPITVKILRAEVPLHYLLNFTRDRFAGAVELGVHAGRRWCREEGVLINERHDRRHAEPRTGIRFTEEMVGQLRFVVGDDQQCEKTGRAGGHAARAHLTIAIDDLDRFVVMPDHVADVSGWFECEALGGRLALERGTFNLFVDVDDPANKRMLYEFEFRDGVGRQLVLRGHKILQDDPGRDLWRDATTLYVSVFAAAGIDGEQAVVARGIIRVTPRTFARQLTTFRASAPSVRGRLGTLGRFGRLFAGGLFDVYGRDVLSSSPF